MSGLATSETFAFFLVILVSKRNGILFIDDTKLLFIMFYFSSTCTLHICPIMFLDHFNVWFLVNKVGNNRKNIIDVSGHLENNHFGGLASYMYINVCYKIKNILTIGHNIGKTMLNFNVVIQRISMAALEYEFTANNQEATNLLHKLITNVGYEALLEEFAPE
ncbi:hypothetical protein ACJX0J_007672, partial [Zea mays]